MADWQIRTARPDDIAAILDLWNEDFLRKMALR